MPTSKFNFKAVTYTYTEDGNVLINMEGDSSVLGKILGTFTAKAGQDAGPWIWKGASFPTQGQGVGGSGSGTAQKDAASGHWKTTGEMTLTDGTTGQLSGEFDLASRTWSGQTNWS